MTTLLPAEPGRDRLLRIDAAVLLIRFLHLERAVVTSAAGWVPSVARLETKALLARTAWEHALTAESLRRRVFELRYPDRSLRPGPNEAVIALYEAALHAPGPAALLSALGEVLVPALRTAYETYLELSDDIADGPTGRFLGAAVRDMRRLEAELIEAAASEVEKGPAWFAAVRAHLEELGGVPIEPTPSGGPTGIVIESGHPFAIADEPARDDRYLVTPFYWPDTLDPSYPYGDGVRLQLRSAVSHLNEVWAVETAAVVLQSFEAQLGWEFLFDAARWLYDESRHMMMGMRRLAWWGFAPPETPLGSYIYEACRDQDPIYRLAMLAFFETKNIGKKKDRAKAFGELGDRTSERDMDFDWADEAIHAGYGRRWLRAALEARGADPEAWPELVSQCERLVAARVAQASAEERRRTFACAEALVAKAELLAHRAEW